MGMTGRKRRSKVRKLMQTWGPHCFYCGQGFSLARPATIEHLVPRSLGGGGQLSNLCLAHERCNVLRGNASIVATLRILETVEGKAKRLRALHKHKELANDIARRLASDRLQVQAEQEG